LADGAPAFFDGSVFLAIDRLPFPPRSEASLLAGLAVAAPMPSGNEVIERVAAVATLLARVPPGEPVATEEVLASAHHVKVVGVHAGPIAAEVIEDEARGDRPMP
jgi:hypothetical protein